jgi:hypothetical protein
MSALVERTRLAHVCVRLFVRSSPHPTPLPKGEGAQKRLLADSIHSQTTLRQFDSAKHRARLV